MKKNSVLFNFKVMYKIYADYNNRNQMISDRSIVDTDLH